MRTHVRRLGVGLAVCAMLFFVTAAAFARGGRGGFGGGFGGGGFSARGPAASGSFGGRFGGGGFSRAEPNQGNAEQRESQRQSAVNENETQRQSHQEEMQDDRQHWAGHHMDDYYHGGAYYGHGVVVVDGHDEDAGAALAAGLVIGTVVTAAAMQSATTRNAASAPACTMTHVTVGQDSYYKCGSNWFQKALANGEVTYVVVNPPPGF